MTADLSKLTVVELRAELKKHGLPQSGKKADLVERLSSTLENGSAQDPNKEPANNEQAAEERDPSPATATTPEPADEVPAEPVTVQAAPTTDAVEAVDVTVAIGNGEDATTHDGSSADVVDGPPLPEPTATATISVAEESVPSESAPAVSEVINDVQTRKRRSRTPSVDASVRKRLRPDDPEPRHIDVDMADDSQAPGENAAPPAEGGAAEPKQESSEQAGPAEPVAVVASPQSKDPAGDDVVMEEKYEGRPDHHKSPPAGAQGYPSGKIQEDESAGTDYGTDDRPVVPAIHPATSALYIKNFMRPLRTVDVKDHVIALATPPSQAPNPDVVIDFYLDPIRTHALVSFNSISAASRVRSALHDQVWPDERNRKALWVDFIPADKVLDWIEIEEAEGGGRAKMNRWEVVYGADADGNMTARLEEGGPDIARPNPRAAAPPTGPASTYVPTGPSQPAASGIQGAPTGPRGRGGRMPPGYPLQGSVTPQEGSKTTRALPSLVYRPQPEDIVQRRVDNMRSYYTKDRYRDMGPAEDINRYTFENVDSFVDRGKEVFVGIRPPHRERQMRAGGGGGPGGPRRGGPPPASFRPRGDRYLGGRRDGGDSFAPRSRFDGAPLPTYDGRSDRQGRYWR